MSGPNKLLLIILDGVPWRNFRSLFGNLEGWVESGEARVWKMRAVVPSISAACYASIHTGVTPAVHGCTGNTNVFRLPLPDVFSEVRRSGGVTGAVAHSYWSELYNRAPFDPVQDLEYNEPDSASINYGRFYSMTGDNRDNQMTPSDADLFALMTMLTERHGLDYGMMLVSTLDSMGHRFQHDCEAMDQAIFKMDEYLAPFITRWRKAGYEVIVTADHGQNDRGHHGGSGADQQDTALYYFGPAAGPDSDQLIDMVQLAPTILTRMGVPVPETMKAASFLSAE